MRGRKGACIPWGFIALALGLGIVMAILFPAGMLVIVLAAALIWMGILLARRW